jgi:threonine dehydrogenase-like Zn-dependent dehydrogenase
MRANVWMGKKDVRVETVPDPKILSNRDCIVRVTSTAICGSDLHLYNGFVPTMEKGDILGHEFMGEVMEVGSGVNNLKVGQRVIVPFPIACGACGACQSGKTACCENSNPNAWMQEKLMGHSTAGIFGYSHQTGGFAGGQAEFVRVPFADVNPFVVDGMTDEQALFLTDILPTGYMAADMADIKPGSVVAVFGCGPVGQFAIASARLMGAERIIAIDRFPYRLNMAVQRAGATDAINYEEGDLYEKLKELTGGRGPDACLDCVGMEAHGHGVQFAMDRAKQIGKLQLDRAVALRDCILTCATGGTVSVVGVYAGFIDKFPMGSLMNRGLTLRAGQCHVHRYVPQLMEHIQAGRLDPTFIITHRMSLEEAAHGYDIFMHKEEECMKIILKTGRN